MSRSTPVLTRSLLATLLAAAALAPAAAATPQTPRYESEGAGKWVFKVDPANFGGATGTVTFFDDGYRGPGGASVNDFAIGEGYDPSRPAFSQDVRVVQRDLLTADPVSSPMSDGSPAGLMFSDANMDGSVNLGPFGWTTPPGTRFLNMQIDSSGNYFVAQRDMTWGFFDSFDYQRKAGGGPTTSDTQFNFQPYPLSDAFGWCGSVLASVPEAVERQAGQLVFDVAFDVYPLDAEPGGQIPPMTQIVPGFVMRSYGRYEVDVNWTFGSQRFAGGTVGNNVNPMTGEIDRAWQNQVSPVGAGVIPTGAWVTDEGTPQMKVVTEGTPGATFHRNLFAGAAFILRGDVRRSVTYRQGVDYLDSSRWTAWPLQARGKGTPEISLTRVARRGKRVLVDGRVAGGGVVSVGYAGGAARSARAARLRFGRFSARLPLPRRGARRADLTISYAGDRNNLARTVRRSVRLR